ncbi:hypothetical protein SFR_0797 [Streptomyces sp. FR-008]|nr:hypothetical protein SFR_0797 [Streptomyces sp. FR-008]
MHRVPPPALVTCAHGNSVPVRPAFRSAPAAPR